MENPKKGDVVLHGKGRARIIDIEGTAVRSRGLETLYRLEFLNSNSGRIGCFRETFTFPAPEAKEKIEPAAYHEAGHIVIAANQGLKLRPEGFMVDLGGMGLARFCTKPEECDVSREGVILASFAGFLAELRFCETCSRPAPEPMGYMLSSDWIEARTTISKLSTAYSPGDNPVRIQAKLELRAKRLVEHHWNAIETLAAALLAKDLQPTKLLESGEIWSYEATARFVDGKETLGLLAQHGIAAACEPCAVGATQDSLL